MPSSTPYDSLAYDLAAGTIVLAGPAAHPLHAILVNGYVPDPASHATLADVAGEVTGTGYTAGGQALAGVTATRDAADRWTLLTATAPAWPGSTITATGCVICDATNKHLVSYVDFGGPVSSNGSTLTVAPIATSGFLKIKV